MRYLHRGLTVISVPSTIFPLLPYMKPFLFIFPLFLFENIYVCIFISLLSYTKGSISYTPSFTLLFCVTLHHGDHTITTGKDHLHSFLELHSILLYKYTLGLFNQFATDGYFGFKYFSVTKTDITNNFMHSLFCIFATVSLS